jgi:ribosome-interacting GTPase 1
LVDTPPIQLDHIDPGLSNQIRNTDALLLVVDLTKDPVFQMEALIEELTRMKIKIVKKEPFPSLEEGWVFLKALLVGNKCDVKKAMEGYRATEAHFKEILLILPISAREEMNFETLKKEIYQLLDIIRIYTKVPGEEADLAEPVILKKGSTVEDVAHSVHKDFVTQLRYAKIWGSGKFDGQMVKRDYQVTEGDVIELHL